MNNISPNTPKNKRYSCSSEYATPGVTDDSDDSSLYYSFALSEDDDILNKENSINEGQRTVVNLTPGASHALKTKTPLLRKVLQSNFTPSNKNKKRVSFSFLPKHNLTIESGKIAKTAQNVSDIGTDGNLKSFECLPFLPIETYEKKNEKPSYHEVISENGLEYGTANDTASDITDDLENEMHNTIIENSASASSNTLISDGNEIQTSDSSKKSKSPLISPIQVLNVMEDRQPSDQRTQDLMQKNIPAKLQCANAGNTKTVEDILHEANAKLPQSRNTIKMNRQRLANENRKSILPVAKKASRTTIYTRRSSTYEPRKVDPRKTLDVLRKVANKVSKSIAVQPNIVDPTSSIDRNQTSKPIVISKNSKSTSVKVEAVTSRGAKPRLTVVNQPPKMPVVSTRQSVTNNIRVQRRETKSSITALAMASASNSSTLSTFSNTELGQARFVRPTGVPIQKMSSSTTKSNGNKCQYCDKCFVKSHGMSNHLLEHCQKIPSNVRRQLLQKEESRGDVNSKQVSRRKTLVDDSISKYSRFFSNLTNENASGMQGAAAIDKLRAELRKESAHTGIVRTPSKPIRCHVCKKLFFDCVEYAEHATNAINHK